MASSVPKEVCLASDTEADVKLPDKTVDVQYSVVLNEIKVASTVPPLIELLATTEITGEVVPVVIVVIE